MTDPASMLGLANHIAFLELRSYQIKADQLLPVRYGTSSDVQLWNATDLVVQFVLSGLPAP